MKNKIKCFVMFFSALIVLSCNEKKSYSKIDATQTVIENDAHKIVTIEVIDGGSYTYIKVENSGSKYWMAIPKTEVKEGETYYYNGGMVMQNFESKQLNRTFDLITFADGIRTTPEIMNTKQKNPEANAKLSKINVKEVEITQAKNGISLEELFRNKETYSKKSIIIKGLVVKVNNNILDKNWVHIMDGTQFDTKKNLTISTNDIVKIGDTVTFKGILALEKKIGEGYVYPILLEKGELIQ